MTTTEEPTSTGGSTKARELDDAAKRRMEDPTHWGIDRGEEWPEDVPKGQDDSWWRFQDDPRGARRAELRIAACWTITAAAGIALMVTYCLGASSQAIGIELFFGFVGLGVGMLLWARDLLPGHEVTASRGHHHVSLDEDRASIVDSLDRVVGPVARRPFLFKMLQGVGLVFGLGALFPIASLGDRPHTVLYKTGWGKGERLVTEDGTPLRPSDVVPGGILTVFPAKYVKGPNDNTLTDPDAAQSATLLINVGDAPFKVLPKRVGWNIGGLVAFSKICTHAGCPVGLYNQRTQQLVCPCHQSTFNVLQDCKPVFGPAPRSLPQLPLAVDSDGYLIAQADYDQAVGPGFWNRG